jgi:hypothetical protein
MTDTREINFRDLQHLLLRLRPLPEGSKLLELQECEPQSAFLDDLIPFYGDQIINARHAIAQSAVLDQLSNFYGILVVASIADYIPRELPGGFREQALAQLSHPALRQYYEQQYPQFLPQIARQYLLGDIDIREDAPSHVLWSPFGAFLSLTVAHDTNLEVRKFERLLQDHKYRNVGIVDLLDLFANPESLCHALLEPGPSEMVLHEVTVGFYGFLRHLSEFAALLNKVAGLPLLRAAMWCHSAYWFDIMADRVTTTIRIALHRIQTWPVRAEDLAGLRTFAEDTETMMRLLLDRSIGDPLLRLTPEVDLLWLTERVSLRAAYAEVGPMRAAAIAQNLEGLRQRLAAVPHVSHSSALRILRTLGDLLDGPPNLMPPLLLEIMRTKILECYGSLSRWLSDADLLRTAVEQTKKWLRNPAISAETVRNVLVPLLSSHPDQPDLLAEYGALIKVDWGLLSREAQSLVEIALVSLPVLAELDQRHLVEFLEEGFVTATRSWRALGYSYASALTRILALARLRHNDLDRILGRVHVYLNTEGLDLLADGSRGSEYADLCGLVVAIHQAMGLDRRRRPRNRHVVIGGADVSVRLRPVEFPGNIVTGRIVNFAVGDDKWCGGAFVESSHDGGWPNIGKEWRDSMAVVEHPSMVQPLVLPTKVCGPEAVGSMYGFRVKWPSVSLTAAAQLSMLAELYPITR